MGYLFEIYNEKDELTKKGIITSDAMQIPYSAGDSRYVIRHDTYPFAIYREGILNNRQAYKSFEGLGRYVGEINGKIEFFVNDINEKVFHEKDGLVTEYAGKRTIFLPVEVGEHTLTNASKTKKAVFKCSGETSASIIMRCVRKESQFALAKAAATYAAENNLDGHEAILHLIRNNLSSWDDKTTYDAYSLLKQYESLMNTRHAINTNSSWQVDNVINCRIEEKEIDRVVVYKIEQKKKIHYDSFTLSKKSEIVCEDYTSLFIEGYNGDQFISARMASILPQSVKSLVWKLKKEEEAARLRALERGVLNNWHSVDPVVEESIHYLNSVSYRRELIDKPVVEYTDEQRLHVRIEGLPLLEALTGEFYLAMCEPKDLNGAIRTTRIPVEELLSIDLYNEGINEEEDLFLWVEDREGIIVSEYAMIPRLNEREYVLNIFESYEQKRIEDAILREIKEEDKAGYDQFIRNMMTTIFTEQGVDKKKVVDEIVYQFFLQGMWEKSWYILKCLLIARLGKDSSGVQFFDEDIQLEERSRKVFIPPTPRSYIVMIERFDEKEKTVDVSYHKNIQEFVIDASYVNVHFIDTNNYDKSGFVMFGGPSKKPVYTTERMNVRLV